MPQRSVACSELTKRFNCLSRGCAIEVEDLEYEVETPENGDIRVYRFHFLSTCDSMIWIEECARGGAGFACLTGEKRVK